MGLADMLQTHASDDTAPTITRLHEQWLAEGGEYTQEAIDWAAEQFGYRPMPGPKAFRASEAGSCPRRRVLTRFGPKPPKPTLSLKNTFQTGSFLHLKWQMAGLSAGWLTSAETFFYGPDPDQPLIRGKVDGILEWGGVFEYKSCGDRDWDYVTSYDKPKWDHRMQAGEAMEALDADVMHIIYEHKADGEWREFIIYRDPDLVSDIHADRVPIRTALDTRTVPPAKPLCVEQTGQEFYRCPWREECPMAEILVDWNKETR